MFRYANEIPVNKQAAKTEDAETLRDVLNQPVRAGDEVMYIRHSNRKAPKLLRGTVGEVAERSVLIQNWAGESCRVFVSEDDPVWLPKVLVLHSRPERKTDGPADATGYPLLDGDPAVYMPPLVNNKCKGFVFGTVKKAGSAWEVNGTRRPPDRIIIVNW